MQRLVLGLETVPSQTMTSCSICREKFSPHRIDLIRYLGLGTQVYTKHTHLASLGIFKTRTLETNIDLIAWSSDTNPKSSDNNALTSWAVKCDGVFQGISRLDTSGISHITVYTC